MLKPIKQNRKITQHAADCGLGNSKITTDYAQKSPRSLHHGTWICAATWSYSDECVAYVMSWQPHRSCLLLCAWVCRCKVGMWNDQVGTCGTHAYKSQTGEYDVHLCFRTWQIGWLFLTCILVLYISNCDSVYMNIFRCYSVLFSRLLCGSVARIK